MDYPHLFLLSIVLRYVGAIVVFAIGLHLAKNHWDRIGFKCAALYYAGRVGALAVLCRIGNNYPMDLPEWYKISRWMVEGRQFPGIDFSIGYNLGFSGILAGATWIYDSPFAILFPWMLCEMSAMAIFFLCLRKLYDERLAKRTIICYLLSPICLFASWLGAQDEPIFLLFAALATTAILFSKRQTAWTSAVAFFSFFFTKIIAPIFLMPFFLMKKRSGILICAAAIGLYFAGAMVFGINPLNLDFSQQVGDAGSSLMTMDIQPGNVWYFIPIASSAVQNVILVAMLALAGLSLLPEFFNPAATNSGKLEAAFVLHGAWILTMALLFRYNFVSYMIPFAFYAVFTLWHSGQGKPQRHYAGFVIGWMCIVVLKDFPFALKRLGLMNQLGCDVYSSICLVANVLFACAFFRVHRHLFHAPWRAIPALFHR